LGNLTNSGATFAPGASPAASTILGNFTQTAGKLEIELGGTIPGTQFDTLGVTGSANLAGGLDVKLFGGFVPSPGSSFLIINTVQGLEGTFDVASLPTINGLNWQLNYTPNSLLLRAVILGDYNHNGFVDAADYSVWRN